MDYEVKKNVFTSFFSTKGSSRGTGLGLLTTRKIVQEHGGTVSFESTEGVGSLLRMEFPRNRLPILSNSAERPAEERNH
jgi:signal transduction histidine kinase